MDCLQTLPLITPHSSVTHMPPNPPRGGVSTPSPPIWLALGLTWTRTTWWKGCCAKSWSRPWEMWQCPHTLGVLGPRDQEPSLAAQGNEAIVERSKAVPVYSQHKMCEWSFTGHSRTRQALQLQASTALVTLIDTTWSNRTTQLSPANLQNWEN